jgi:aminoglycoside phosphotransferase (APT) family kinase protein
LIEERFLAYLRERFGDVSYARPPTPMTGGYVTDVYAFDLNGAPDEWSGPLVLRVYPNYADPLWIRRERCAQEVASVQGLAAPRVLACEDAPGSLDRAFMVMERMPGRPIMGGADFPRIVWELPRIMRMPVQTAKVMGAVHALDAAPLIAALAAAGIDRRAAGPDCWLDTCERFIDEWQLDGLRGGLAWLRSNRPPDPARPSVCHGDLWGANILVDKGRVTGILDWNLVTVADPAFEIGGQLANLEMAPITGPRPVRWIAKRIGNTLGRRLRSAYGEIRHLDPDAVRYYSIMRAFSELTFKLAAEARIRATGVSQRTPAWIPEQCAAYILDRTGVRVEL